MNWAHGNVYMEIVAAIIGVFGSAVIAAAIYFGDLAVARSQTTMELLRELHSPEIAAARAQARDFVLAHKNVSFDALDEGRGLSQTQKTGRVSLFTVTRFFYRLNVLRTSELLQDNKIFALFGPLFAYWWAFTFESQLNRSTWSTKEEIESLHEWMVQQATRLDRLADWRRWLDIGSADRQRPPPPEPGSNDGSPVAEQIGKLWDLHLSGAMTADEFDRAKTVLIGSA